MYLLFLCSAIQLNFLHCDRVSNIVEVLNSLHPRLPRAGLQREQEGVFQQRILDGWKEPVPGHRLPGHRLHVRGHVTGHAHCLC